MKAFAVCQEIIDTLIAHGIKLQIRRKDLEETIMYKRGIDPRTVEKWIKALLTFQYITQENANIYKFNFKHPYLIEIGIKQIREEPQTRLQ